MEQVVRSAVERCGRENLVPRVGDVQERERFRRLPGGSRNRSRAALELRHSLLEDVGGRVHDPCVDIAELLKAE